MVCRKRGFASERGAFRRHLNSIVYKRAGVVKRVEASEDQGKRRVGVEEVEEVEGVENLRNTE